MNRLLRDPLLHFLAAGALLFVVFRWVDGPAAQPTDDRNIVVNRSELLTFMQYQANAFEPKYFGAQLDAMSAKQKQALIDQYVRQEALYREANAMGLAQGDYVIRRRMIQKMLYLIEDTATESFAPTNEELERYFKKHKDRYEVAPSLTFTHVFVDGELRRPGSAEAAAEHLKQQLQAEGAGFTDAPRYGDRFPYQQNYVNRTPDYIENQFGASFAAAVMKLAPSEHDWQGPIESRFGYHLVLLTQHKAPHLPKLAEVREQVKDDLLRDTIAAYRDRAIADLTRTMTVEVDGVSLESAVDRTAATDRAAKVGE